MANFLGRTLLDWEDNTLQENIIFTSISIVLVIFAGLMSGLTLGLMSLDLTQMEVLKRSGTAQEKRHAAKIVPLIANNHYLLVTLLLCNAGAMEALPLFLDRMASPVMAILLSVTAVLFFGEIIPQAVCTRYGLMIGARLAWLVRLLMLITGPVSWPVGQLLDRVLGSEHHVLFRRQQLKALVDIHGEDTGLGGKLSADEIKVITGALDLTNKIAFRSMTPLDNVFMLSTNDKLDEPTLRAILDSGHSRIPVYRAGSEGRRDVVGLLLVKELLQYKMSRDVPVAMIKMRSLPRLSAMTPMYDLLKLFQTGRSHMAILTQPYPEEEEQAQAALQAQLQELGELQDDAGGMAEGAREGAAGEGAGEGYQPPALEGPAGAAGEGQEESTGANGEAGSSGAGPSLYASEQPDGGSVRAGSRLGGGSGGQQQPSAGTLARNGSSGGLLRSSQHEPGSPSSSSEARMGPRTGSNSNLRQQPSYDPDADVSVRKRKHARKQEARKRVQQVGPLVPLLAPPGEPIGIITIEDVIEELIRAEIVDETDKYVDNEHHVRVEQALLMQTLPERLKQVVAGHPSVMLKTSLGRMLSSSSSLQGVMSTHALQSLDSPSVAALDALPGIPKAGMSPASPAPAGSRLADSRRAATAVAGVGDGSTLRLPLLPGVGGQHVGRA